MDNVYCWECGGKISKDAAICSKCGAKQKDVSKFTKDNGNINKKSTPVIVWVLLVIFGLPFLILISIIVIALLVGMGSASNTDLNNTINNSNYVEAITKENYDIIKIDMTKEQVFSILGNNATISVTETPGLGTMELYHYQKAFSTKAIMITFLNGKVYSKNWVEL